MNGDSCGTPGLNSVQTLGKTTQICHFEKPGIWSIYLQTPFSNLLSILLSVTALQTALAAQEDARSPQLA